MRNIDKDETIKAWQMSLGREHVVTAEIKIAAMLKTTFRAEREVPAVLRPATTAEVQTCMRIASHFRIPVYPFSRGRNWGMGGRVPTSNGCVLMDLGRMDRIIDYNDSLGYLTVQPGVTFQQASDFLRNAQSRNYIAAIGGPPDASLIGNMIERGDVLGPYGDRFQHVCALVDCNIDFGTI